jgi:hypothetical protein
MKLPKLKRGDLIEVIGRDWTTFSEWKMEDDIMDWEKFPLDVISFVGFYVGVSRGFLFWSNARIIYEKDLQKPECKYSHRMPLVAITKVRKAMSTCFLGFFRFGFSFFTLALARAPLGITQPPGSRCTC